MIREEGIIILYNSFIYMIIYNIIYIFFMIGALYVSVFQRDI